MRIIRILLGPLKPELLLVNWFSQRRRRSKSVTLLVYSVLGVILGHDLVGRDLVWDDGRHLVQLLFAYGTIRLV